MGQLYKALAIMRWLPNTTQKHGRKTPQGHIRIPRTEPPRGGAVCGHEQGGFREVFYRNAIFGAPTTINDKAASRESFLLSNNPDSALAYLGPLYKEENAGIDLKIMIATMLGLGKIYWSNTICRLRWT